MRNEIDITSKSAVDVAYTSMCCDTTIQRSILIINSNAMFDIQKYSVVVT